MKKKLFLWLQYVLPHHLLSHFFHYLGNSKIVWLKNYLIRLFIRQYGVDLRDAIEEDATQYSSFNTFFVRPLKSEVRPISKEPTHIISPVDGCISQIGTVDYGRIFQAKKHYYSAVELLGGVIASKKFLRGGFATIYLAPKDYHRVHMPCSGSLNQMIHVPGRLFSVNDGTTETCPNLFARNERVISIFDTEIGAVAIVMVGAMIVSGIETVWSSGLITPSHSSITQTCYKERDLPRIQLVRGAEMGRFSLGSTVIMLFENRAYVKWLNQWKAGSTIKMGEAMASSTA